MMYEDPVDSLYLTHYDETFIVSNSNVPSHHTDGIRFLFKQFKTKKPGVIINDPYGYGRNIQTILFLKAIRRLLTKPVLIICEEGNKFEWVERFDTWTDMYHEVTIETHYPSTRKMIMINTMINLPNFCKHDWSVLIVDGQKDKAVYQILKLPFKADFKIWNTPLNMRENLKVFGELFKWLYPKEQFDESYFVPDHTNTLDVYEKMILLDSFMEDIVIRRDDLTRSFDKYQRENLMPPPKAPPKVPPVPSKKNKDATGTKIKRSKGRAAELAKEDSDQAKVVPHTAVTEEAGGSSSGGLYDSKDDYSIQNFKRNYDGDFLNSEIESQFKTIDINPSENSELKLYYESDPIPPNVDEINHRAFGSSAFDSPSGLLRKRGSNIPFTYSEDNLSESDDEVFIHKQKSADIYNDFVLEGTSSNSKSSPSDDQIAAETPLPNDDETYIDNKTVTAECDSLSLIPNNGSMNLNLSENLHDVQPEISQENEKANQSERLQDIGAASIKQVTNNLKRNNIDDKIKECEAKVAKKFKGSFLDSLF